MGALFKSNASTTQSSSQTTNQQDNRIVNGDGAVAFSNSNGNSISSNTDSHNITNVTTTDFGAIQGSMTLIASGQREDTTQLGMAYDFGQSIFENGVGFAEHALQGVVNNSNAMMRTTEQVLGQQANTQANATAAIKDAFTSAKAGEQKILVGAALAMVVIVALRK